MKNTLLGLLLTVATVTFTFADIVAKPSRPSLPSKPIVKPIKPSFDRLTRDDYDYNPLYNDTEIEQEKRLSEKKEKIEALEREINATKEVEYKKLQEKNKAQYDEEMKKFDNRKSKVKTENSISISDKPVK